MNENTSSAIAAAVILIVFGVVAYFMPQIMMIIGDYSIIAAVFVAIFFMSGFYLLFWVRSRRK